MNSLIQLYLGVTSLAVRAPNPIIDYSKPLEAKNTKGTVTVVYKNDEPTELTIQFEPKNKTEFPSTNALRILKIDLKTGIGKFTRTAYTDKDSKSVDEASVEFRSDTACKADNGKKPLGLLGSVLGQPHQVAASSDQYWDIANNPIIKAYSNGDKSTLDTELSKLRKK